jgi:hypothetical protein
MWAAALEAAAARVGREEEKSPMAETILELPFNHLFWAMSRT